MSFQSTGLVVAGEVPGELPNGVARGGSFGETSDVAWDLAGGLAVVVPMNALVYYPGGGGLCWRGMTLWIKTCPLSKIRARR